VSPFRPVVALDIDGTLGDYHKHFTWFAEQWTGRKMPDPDEINPGVALHKHLGMGKALYRECKLAYRRGGLKRFMPCYEGSAELTRHIRASGAAVWICTTRPYLRFDGIDPDTRHWLRRNKIQWDGVLFGERKFRELLQAVDHGRIILAVDDLPAMCCQAHDLGLPWLLRDQPYNQHWSPTELPEGWPYRAHTVDEIRSAFGRAMYNWRESHAGQ
jgi:hypothetical protein